MLHESINCTMCYFLQFSDVEGTPISPILLWVSIKSETIMCPSDPLTNAYYKYLSHKWSETFRLLKWRVFKQYKLLFSIYGCSVLLFPPFNCPLFYLYSIWIDKNPIQLRPNNFLLLFRHESYCIVSFWFISQVIMLLEQFIP